MRPERPSSGKESAKARSSCWLASTRTVTFCGAPADEGETRANSSLRSSGFSTMPTTVRRRPSRSSVAPSSTLRSAATPSVRATWPRPGRVAATAEREEIAAVGPIRVLRAEVHRLDAAGHGNLAVADDSVVPNDSSADARAASSACGSEPSNMSSPLAEPNSPSNCRTRVVDEDNAADRGRDRDRQERHHQDLLAPLAAEHAPAPSGRPRGGRRRRRFGGPRSAESCASVVIADQQPREATPGREVRPSGRRRGRRAERPRGRPRKRGAPRASRRHPRRPAALRLAAGA